MTAKKPTHPKTNQNLREEVVRREQTETELIRVEEERRLMCTVFMEAMDPILIEDLSGHILTLNAEAERVYGRSRDELLGWSIKTLIPPQQHCREDELLERCKRGEEIRNVEGLRLNKAREAFPVLVTLSLLTDSHGQPRAIASIAKDIRAFKRAQEKLREHEQLAAIGLTTSKLVHEIANPLNGMSTTLQLMELSLAKRQATADETLTSTVHDLKDLKTEIDRLGALLHDFRSLSRPLLSLQPTTLASVVDEVLTIGAPHYIEHGIRVEQQCPPTLPLVSADAERIKQVLLNLCQNAAEAMPHRGTLTIRGYTVGEQVCLDVEDTGVGIPDDVDVFVPFTTPTTEGTGLGLLIVRQIVSAHGASLTYTSQLGRGTTFTLTFPAPKLGTRLI